MSKKVRIRAGDFETQGEAALAVLNYFRHWRDEARRLTEQTTALLQGRAEEGVDYDQAIARANQALDNTRSARNRYIELGGDPRDLNADLKP